MDCSCMNPSPSAISCPNTVSGSIDQFPAGMGYVPWQQWGQTYTMEQALNRGTIFPALDLPFVMGRCGA